MQQGPYTPPPPAYGDNQIRPALWWFFVAGGLALVGIVGGIALIVSGVVRLADTVEDFERVSVPGTGEVRIDETGGYSIYHEYDQFGSSRFYPPEPDVTVTDPSGTEVDLERYSGTVTYDFNNHEGEGLYTFDADETGTYTVTVEGDSESVVAVGRGVGRGLVTSILAGVAVGFIGVVGGIVMAVVVGVKRSGNRRRLRANWNPPPGPPPGAWGPAPGVPGWGPQPPPGQPAPPPPPPPGPSSGTF
jgi:hypothetical protein